MKETTTEEVPATTRKGLHIIRAMYGEFKHPGNVVPVREKWPETPWWERLKRALLEGMR